VTGLCTGLSVVRPDIFTGFDTLLALQTTRKGGSSLAPYDSLNLGLNTGDDRRQVENNFDLLCSHLKIDRSNLVFSDQVHGTEILQALEPGGYKGFDAIISDRPGLYLCIFTADCFPVLVYDSRNRAAGAIHAGWKGTAGQIVLSTLKYMRDVFRTRPEDCFAYVGTGISAEHYEVGEEVARHFSDSYLTPSSTADADSHSHLLDLAGANMDQLRSFGIPVSQIECSRYCSSRNNALFYSYRRDGGRTGRMLSMIGLMH
jgi:hypothetical protein